jgi:hypothetical protein
MRAVHRRIAFGIAAFALAACSSSPTGGSEANLIVRGSSHPVGASIRVQGQDSGWTETIVGDPASMSITMYDLYLSPNADCSEAFLAQSYGTDGEARDFTQSPTLFQASVPAGSYPCVAIRMSDVIGFTPASSGGGCQAGTAYTGDIYRTDSDSSLWRDIHGNPIPATGSDSVPSNDHVTVIFTTDTLAAFSAGFSPDQTIWLAHQLVAPTSATFVWDATNAIVTDGTRCGMNPGVPSFE